MPSRWAVRFPPSAGSARSSPRPRGGSPCGGRPPCPPSRLGSQFPEPLQILPLAVPCLPAAPSWPSAQFRPQSFAWGYPQRRLKNGCPLRRGRTPARGECRASEDAGQKGRGELRDQPRRSRRQATHRKGQSPRALGAELRAEPRRTEGCELTARGNHPGALGYPQARLWGRNCVRSHGPGGGRMLSPARQGVPPP
ncbi:hypothetical protein SCOCK_800005 [Actinacidiphila cocklensis]|uniref:Uncharacterized protein n=1 Tax=Actinacidiphila cocklensis TaxID=887465 RepID=A0A9W4E1B0_9ACTN|nr:hypothetical protein SCOCK_800005 [Actinacidiphila cocklensis]